MSERPWNDAITDAATSDSDVETTVDGTEYVPVDSADEFPDDVDPTKLVWRDETHGVVVGMPSSFSDAIGYVETD